MSPQDEAIKSEAQQTSPDQAEPEESVEAISSDPEGSDSAYDEDDEETIRQRLEALGYL